VITLFIATLSADQAMAAGKRPLHDEPSPAPAATVAERLKLSEVIGNRVSGLALEDPTRREALRTQAKTFMDYRNNRLSETAEEALIARCKTVNATEDPFCAAILIIDAKRDPESRRSERRKRRSRIAQIKQQLRSGKLDGLKEFSEADLCIALKGVSRFESVRPMINKLLAEPECASTSAVYLSFGLRTERGFPEQGYRDLASQLYSKAVQCGSDASAVHAGYRLGLLKVWDGKHQEADEALAKVIDSPHAVDFRLRIAYWRYYSASKTGDNSTQSKMRELLMREYPLSLHGLLVSTEDLFGDLPMLNSREPEVALRTQSNPALNAAIRGVETLQEMGEPTASFEMLETVLDRMQSTEVSFQLYVAVVLTQSGNAMRGFQYVAALYRQNPFLISRPTLELLYPLHRFEVVRDHSSKLDPYLVLSLIRQESAFNERARSPAGALGLMQLTPRTARGFERVSKRQLFDPKINVRVGVKYFSRLLKRFDYDVELALASYNAGPARINEWQKRYPIDNRLLFLDMMPFRETREYVSSIVRNYYWYLRLYSRENLNRTVTSKPNSSQFRIFKASATPASLESSF